jgi:hypothetical protein
MALNFGAFQTAQPVTAFFKGQEDVARDVAEQENRMLAREKLAQEREVNALRRQQLMGEIEQQQQTQRKQARVEKTGAFRDRLLRAATPEAAREVVKMQYADPDVGPLLSQFSTLDQALAEVPDDPTQFQTYRQQEAMGMSEWIKSQASERGFQSTMSRLTQLRGGQPAVGADTAAPVNAMAAAPVNAMAAAPSVAAPTQPATGAGARRSPESIAAEIDLLSQSPDPRVKAMAARLMEEYKDALVQTRTRSTKPASLQELEAYMAMTPEQKIAFEKLQKIKQPNVSATASATSPTGKSLAAPVGARAETSLVKAEGAAGIMESANMVREALNSGNVIAGTLAGPRLKFAQLMETVGAGDKQKLVNTRSAIQGLATLTLESRAELKGQGQVTENEQKLLEKARSASVEDMTVAELQQVVNVSQRLANRLWSNHQNLLKTMETDPAAADSIRYYRPAVTLPQAVGEGKPQTPAETDKRKQGLDSIFNPPPQRR